MSAQPPAAVVGCLLDVSHSMRKALESDRVDEAANQRLNVVVRAALELAKAEQERDGNAYMFVGVFGVAQGEGNPPVIDLCGLIKALDQYDDQRSGHQALLDLANKEGVPHISEYIETRLTASEARTLHAYLQRHPERVGEFVSKIPDKNTDERYKAGSKGADIGIAALSIVVAALAMNPVTAPIVLATGATAFWGKHQAEESATENSEALKLARQICREWLYEFKTFSPLRVGEVVCLLERMQKQTHKYESRHDGNASVDNLGDTIRQYMYGLTPMGKALDESLDVFRRHSNVTRKALFVVSDGLPTDGDPIPKAQELRSANVTIAAVYLTSNDCKPRRRFFDRAENDWNRGQRTLFKMASKVSASTHPVPVLNSLGWTIPSSGECALYATISSGTVLDELCSMLFRARFGSTDVLFDVIGRVRLDAYVNDSHVRTCNNPSDQGQSSTCYAHAIAAIIHMSLLRIEGRQGGHPGIPVIRKRILAAFPPGKSGQVSRKVLERATAWYRPLHFNEVNEEGARQAVLRRRPVLATFRLSDSGWNTFSQHFGSESSRSTTLKREHMEQYRKETQNGGHAVVLTGCDPTSLTFLNSWGNQWADNGSFSVEDASVLSLDDHPIKFYDVYWLESDLVEGERRAYANANTAAFQTRASQYPSILEVDAQCPNCEQSAPIVNFTGDIREAICPNCHSGFAPEPSHLLQALYARHGLGGARSPGDR